MDGRQRQRTVYVTARQKKKLIQLITKHPELISCRVTQGFNYSDSQRLWHNIANECNSIPGAKKTWRQWRKTWQDLRSKYKKRHAESNGILPSLLSMLTKAEKEALGLKNDSSTEYQDDTEFVPLEQDNMEDNLLDEVQSNASHSETETIPEHKVHKNSVQRIKKLKTNIKHSTKHANKCVFNCDMLAAQEQRKIKIKEDYLNFKKEYLSQKLKIMKEQTEALQSIAKELSK